MAPRPRKLGSGDLPPNLCPNWDKRNGVMYYRYFDVRTRRFHGLGKDKAQAIADAKALNAAIYAEQAEARRSAIITPTVSGITVAEFEPKYWKIVDREQPIKANTRRTRRSILKRVIAALGPTPVAAVSVAQCAGIITPLAEDGKGRMAQAVRSGLIGFFAIACSEGLRVDNPAKLTLQPVAKVKRARLTLETWQAIFDNAGGEPWERNAMLLALVTGQRLEDVARMGPKDVRDGFLHVEQQKNKRDVDDGEDECTRIRISLSLRLNAIGMTVGQVIERCRDSVLSRHFIHHVKSGTHRKRGDAVHQNTISRAFTRAQRRSGLTWKKSPPTFHEQRSLAERLYAAQGLKTQTLLGHKDARMTAVYHDSRGAEWLEVTG